MRCTVPAVLLGFGAERVGVEKYEFTTHRSGRQVRWESSRQLNMIRGGCLCIWRTYIKGLGKAMWCIVRAVLVGFWAERVGLFESKYTTHRSGRQVRWESLRQLNMIRGRCLCIWRTYIKALGQVMRCIVPAVLVGFGADRVGVEEYKLTAHRPGRQVGWESTRQLHMM